MKVEEEIEFKVKNLSILFLLAAHPNHTLLGKKRLKKCKKKSKKNLIRAKLWLDAVNRRNVILKKITCRLRVNLQVGREMNRPGDWNCRSCQHLNFQRREWCQRCGEFKLGAELGVFGGRGRANSSSYGGVANSPGSDVRPGDWYCGVGNCGTHNFANRSSCFKCGAFKDESAAAAGGGGFDFDVTCRGFRSFGFGSSNASRGASSWMSGDWICSRSVFLAHFNSLIIINFFFFIELNLFGHNLCSFLKSNKII